MKSIKEIETVDCTADIRVRTTVYNFMKSVIGSITVGTGGDHAPPPTFRLGDQQCIGPPTSWP